MKNMRNLVSLFLVLASGLAFSDAYDGGDIGLDVRYLSPNIGLEEGDSRTIIFVDPVCIACQMMFKALEDCENPSNVDFFVVASAQQTKETLENKLWFLSSGGDLPASDKGCQIDCTNLSKVQEKNNELIGADSLDRLMRLNKLSRNNAIWKKYLKEMQVTPSFLNLEDMSFGAIKDATHAKKLVGCK